MDNSKYNPQGIAESQLLGSQSPVSNPGVVYQSANTPTNPGGFLSGQTVQQLTFQSNFSGKRIRITMSPGVSPAQSPATIAIIDDQGHIVAEMGASDGILSELFVQRQSTINNSSSLLNVADFSTNTGGATVSIQSFRVLGTHFIPMIALQGGSTAPQQVWLSDGTTPNGVLNSAKGSICLNSSATGQIAYNNNGTTGWTLL